MPLRRRHCDRRAPGGASTDARDESRSGAREPHQRARAAVRLRNRQGIRGAAAVRAGGAVRLRGAVVGIRWRRAPLLRHGDPRACGVRGWERQVAEDVRRVPGGPLVRRRPLARPLGAPHRPGQGASRVRANSRPTTVPPSRPPRAHPLPFPSRISSSTPPSPPSPKARAPTCTTAPLDSSSPCSASC